jgi:signal transduction histidine kinase
MGMVVSDVTEKIRAEEKKILMEASARQQQKLESIGTLASGVAHEINNPITGIMNYAQLIGERLDPSQEQLHEFADAIVDETKRVAKIVHNLLTFSRDEKQTHSQARINDIVDQTLSLIRTIIRKDQITLKVEVPDDLPDIKCRSQQIQQVLMNLLTNARDASNKRYPEYDPNKMISVSVHQFEKDGRNWLRTTVEDHGTGIPSGIRDRIFDPFFTTKNRAEGTGLGLSISLGIVKDHHGELTFESEENQYTRFHLDLPVDNGWETD